MRLPGCSTGRSREEVPAPHQAEMTAVRAGHQLEDGIALPVALHPEHDAFIGPLHRWLSLLLRKLEPHSTVPLGIVAPALAYLHEQEQVHGGFDHVGDLAPRLGADRLDGGSALAEHDLPLALALNVDRLLDPGRAILELLPLIGL